MVVQSDKFAKFAEFMPFKFTLLATCIEFYGVIHFLHAKIYPGSFSR
jgi:hypothetical protein